MKPAPSCEQCRCSFVRGLQHPTLGEVCPVCLHPLKGGKRPAKPKPAKPAPRVVPDHDAGLERDCGVCGAPAGERCVRFDPTLKGRRSWSRLRVPHEAR